LFLLLVANHSTKGSSLRQKNYFGYTLCSHSETNRVLSDASDYYPTSAAQKVWHVSHDSGNAHLYSNGKACSDGKSISPALPDTDKGMNDD